MAILVSPSNNSGWGLGVKSMYGGALRKSATHPVTVRKHYRAPWGSKSRAMALVPVNRPDWDETIEEVVEAARNYINGPLALPAPPSRLALPPPPVTGPALRRSARLRNMQQAVNHAIQASAAAAVRGAQRRRRRANAAISRTLRRVWNRRRRRAR